MPPNSSPTKNILTFDVEDWPQSTLDFSLPITHRVRDNTLRLLDLLAASGVRATFFVLGLVAETFPDLVRRIRTDGHEVASHGYSHRPVFAMRPEVFREDLRRSRALIEDAAGVGVLGYRAPDFSIRGTDLWAFEILGEEGLRYDSSLFPIRGPRYGVRAAFTLPFLVLPAGGSDLIEFPLATLEWMGMRVPAAGGGYFRLFPYRISRAAINGLNRRGGPTTVYLHPYEIDGEEMARSPFRIPWTLRLSQGLMRKTVENKLKRLLREFAWGPAREWLAERDSLTGGRVLDLTALPDRSPRWLEQRIVSR
jgi:polysaccharide deacetylase family protein (PEP-CTERM system associated)